MQTRHKFNAKITRRNNIAFRSKKEARYYDELLLKQKAGIVLFWIRQPKFDLPGGTTYSADFLEFHTDGTCHVVDVKGHRTKEYIRNKKQIEALYPITIEEK